MKESINLCLQTHRREPMIGSGIFHPIGSQTDDDHATMSVMPLNSVRKDTNCNSEPLGDDK